MCGDVVRASSSRNVQMWMDVDRILGIYMSRCDQTLQDMHGHAEMSDIHATKIHWKGLDMRYPGRSGHQTLHTQGWTQGIHPQCEASSEPRYPKRARYYTGYCVLQPR